MDDDFCYGFAMDCLHNVSEPSSSEYFNPYGLRAGPYISAFRIDLVLIPFNERDQKFGLATGRGVIDLGHKINTPCRVAIHSVSTIHTGRLQDRG
jgi:hypothetical protein